MLQKTISWTLHTVHFVFSSDSWHSTHSPDVDIWGDCVLKAFFFFFPAGSRERSSSGAVWRTRAKSTASAFLWSLGTACRKMITRANNLSEDEGEGSPQQVHLCSSAKAIIRNVKVSWTFVSNCASIAAQGFWYSPNPLRRAYTAASWKSSLRAARGSHYSLHHYTPRRRRLEQGHTLI